MTYSFILKNCDIDTEIDVDITFIWEEIEFSSSRIAQAYFNKIE